MRAAAHHVPDAQEDPAAGQGEGVVPVAAHAARLGARDVAARQRAALHGRELQRQERLLKGLRHLALALVEEGVVECEARMATDLDGEVAVRLREAAPESLQMSASVPTARPRAVSGTPM